MKSLGLLMRDFGTGFTIAFVGARREQLLAYLRQQTTQLGCWERLSFALVCRNVAFVSFTELPVGMIHDAKTKFLFPHRAISNCTYKLTNYSIFTRQS